MAAGCWSMRPGWRHRLFHYIELFFAFVMLFFVLCGCFVLARVPFFAYAILVYLLAILLAMNLFVFIVKMRPRRRASRRIQTKTNPTSLARPQLLLQLLLLPHL